MTTTPTTTASPDPTGLAAGEQPPSPSRFRRGALYLAVTMPVGIFAALALIAVWASTEWSASAEGWGGLVLFIVAVYATPVLLLTAAGAITALVAKGRGRRVGATLIVLAAATATAGTTYALVAALPDSPAADDALLAGVCALTVLPWLGFLRGVTRD